MKHKCDGCEHAGKLFGVCLRYSKDIDALIAYKADKCPFEKHLTRFDRIKAMSVEEMANWISNIHNVTITRFSLFEMPPSVEEIKKMLESEEQGE